MTIDPDTPVTPMLPGPTEVDQYDHRFDHGLGCTFVRGSTCAKSPAIAVVRTNQPVEGSVYDGEALCLDHFNAQPQGPVRGDDYSKLCTGEQVTLCCGAYATFHDDVLCCKSCWNTVGLGMTKPDPVEPGDGEIGCTMEIFQRDTEWWLMLSSELFGPCATDDAAIDAIPACLRSTF